MRQREGFEGGMKDLLQQRFDAQEPQREFTLALVVVSGEVETAAEMVTGTVEEVLLRTTRLRDADGTLWHFRNGEIMSVGNRSQPSV